MSAEHLLQFGIDTSQQLAPSTLKKRFGNKGSVWQEVQIFGVIEEQSLQFFTVQQAEKITFNVLDKQPMQTLGEAAEHLLQLLTLDEQHA